MPEITRSPRRRLSRPAGRRLAFAGTVAAGLALAAAVIPAGTAFARGPSPPNDPNMGWPTTATVSSSANPSVVGQPVTYTATVMADGLEGHPPVPVGDGTVSFTDNGTPITGCTAQGVSGGTATCQATPAAGTNTIVADYENSGEYNWAEGTLTQQVVAIPQGCVILCYG